MQGFCLTLFLDKLLKGFNHLVKDLNVVIEVIRPDTFYFILDVIQPTINTFFVLHDYIIVGFC